MTQFSHLTRREDLLQRKSCRNLRKSTDLDRDKRTTEGGCGSRGEFNRGPAMLGTSRAGHRHKSIDQLVKADVQRDVTMRSH